MSSVIRSQRVAAAAVSVGAVLALAACGSGGDAAGELAENWDDVEAAAVEEGTVNLYSVMVDVQNVRLVDAFNEAYPDISVNVTRGANELPTRADAEINSGSDGADVMIYSDPAWFVDRQDAMLPVTGPSVEGWEDRGWAVDERVVIATTIPFSIFVWNTERFPDGFEDWEDFLDPSVQGSVGLREGVTTSQAGFLDFVETELGSEYLEGLAEQNPKFYASVVPMTQAVASGEVGVINLSTPSLVIDLKAEGAPVDSYIPSPSYWIDWAAGAFEKSPRPNAASLLLDFVMSEEGQQAINGDGFGAAAREGVDGALEIDDTAWLFDSTQYPADVIAEYEEKFTQWFG